MLGHKIYQVARDRFPDTIVALQTTMATSHFRHLFPPSEVQLIEGLDATDFHQLKRVLEQMQPTVTINCVGVIKQRTEAKAAIPSITINALLPHKLAEICGAWGGRVIHFSTDCVFNGKRGSYTEEDLSDAEDLYGKTKFLGEISYANTLTLRTSIIGRELARHVSLLDWFISQNHKTVKGFTRAFYSGVTTNHLAVLVSDIIKKHPNLSGLYQVVGQPISKYDLLIMIRDAYQLDIEIVPEKEFYCDRTMKGDKLYQAIGYVCPSWPELISQLATDPTDYESWRQ